MRRPQTGLSVLVQWAYICLLAIACLGILGLVLGAMGASVGWWVKVLGR